MFAKLYNTELGQILIKLDTSGDGKPVVQIFFVPPDMGVCKVESVFEDSSDGWDEAEESFNKQNEESATLAVKLILENVLGE